MLLAGVVTAVVGFVLVLNVGGLAERFAAMATPFPGWVTWPWGTSPTYYRVVGATLVATSAFLLGAALPA